MNTHSLTIHIEGNRHFNLRNCLGAFFALSLSGLSIQEAHATIYELGTSALVVGPTAATNSVVLGIDPTTGAWTATTNDAWLHLSTPNQGGTGSTNVIFSYDANSGATRNGTLTIGGQTLTVTQAGSTYVAAKTVGAVVKGAYAPQGAAVDSAGNVYFADSSFTGTVKERILTNGTVSTLAISGLSRASAVALDTVGNMYVADSGNSTIKEWFAASSNTITLVSAGLSSPSGLTVDTAGNVYIADYGNNAVKEWLAADSNVITLVQSGLSSPTGVAVDAAGNVYIADTGNSAIKEWIAADSNVITLVTSGLSAPQGIAVDGTGRLYLADSEAGGETFTIFEWTPGDTNLTELLGFPGTYFSPEDPYGVTVDYTGNVYYSISGGSGGGLISEITDAFVDPTPRLEGFAAGNDALPAILPITESLLNSFAPSVDQSWLTITGTTNGVVRFSFTANTNSTSRTANISLLGSVYPSLLRQVVPVTQSAQPSLSGAQMSAPGIIHFAYDNPPQTTFTVWSTTDLSVPLTDWTVISVLSNVAPGAFQFTSQATTNDAQRFYRVSSP